MIHRRRNFRPAPSRSARLDGMSSSVAAAVAPHVLAESPRARLLVWPSAPQTVAKVFLGPDGRRRALAVAAALAAVDHRHIAPLLGVVEVDGRPAVLLPRLEPRPVSELLAARGRLSAGEAVTLLVPLLLALLHVERRGLDDRVDLASGLTLDDVLLDASGAPVLVSLSAAPPRGAVSLTRHAGAAGAARRIVAEVLSSTPGGPSTVRTALGDATRPGGLGIDSLIELLFDLDDPAPLEEPLARPAPPPPAASTDAPPTAPPAHHLDGVVPGLDLARAAVGEPGGLAADAFGLAAHVIGRAVAAARDVRPKVWLGAGVVAASALGGLVLTATEGPPAEPGTRSDPAPARADARRTDPPEAAGRSSPPVSTGETTADALLRGDDATAAARVLLRLREDCLTALDAACVAGVDQADSPLLADDLAVVADPARLAEARFPSIAGMAGEYGGAVLFELGSGPDDEPASLLVTRTEAGWRLRSLG